MPMPLPSALRALEPRFMFDAAAVATGAEVMADKAASQQADQAVAEAAKHTEAQHAPAPPVTAQNPQAADSMQPAGASQQAGDASRQVTQESSLADALAAIDAPGSSHSTEIVFIDRSVQDASTLLSGIDPRAEIVFIDDNSDGLDQIAAALKGRTDVSAIHILSHGDPGQIELGNITYDNATLTARAAELAAIGSALTSDGDILLYGCSTADGVLGEQFTHSLSRLTGADVAASTNTTGASALGGDWALEYQVGVIGSLVAVDAQAQERYDSTLDATAATGKGAVLAVYGKDIESIDVTTGKSTIIATVPGTVGGVTVGNTINAIAVDRTHGFIYYQDGSANTNKTLFAYDYLNNTHFVVEADLTSKGITLGSQGTGGGGATFANGVMYLGVEDTNLGGNGNDTIYKVNFAADGRTITTTSVFVQATSGGADWGDLAIDTANNALLSVARTTDGNNNAIRLLDRYDLTSGALLSSTNFATNSVQMSVDGNGNVYVLGGTTITQINPTTGAVIATTNVTSNGSTAVTGTVTDGADGIAASGTIGDQIFQDNNADGVFNGSDIGIANVTVQLVDDVNGNGVADFNERVLATDTTNASGGYRFTGVLPGQYVVQVTDTNGALGGNVSTNGTAARAVSIATIGGSNLTTDFAYQDKAAPVVDLNSGTTTADIATNGSFTGNANGWTTGGTGTTYNNNHIEWTTDNSAGTLTQSGLTGLQSGPASTGAAQVEFGFGWNNSAVDTDQPATLTVSVGGVVYATITTGVAGTGANIATITYQNGASGPATSVGSSPYTAWTYSDILINLPTTVANSGSLVFSYNSGNGSQGDDISIDNVKVLTSTDQTTGRDWNASYTENGAAISISDTDDSVLDNDSANISSGVVTLTNQQAGDRLLIGGTALTNGATGTVNGISYSVVNTGSTITVNLSGTATKAAYAAAIQAITFDNTRDDPASTPVRDITVTVSDGTLTSNTAHSFITVAPVNDAPVNTLPASYSGLEDSTIALSGLSVSDADAGTGNLTITLSVASGSINAASAGGVVVGGTAAARTFTGTLSQLNAYLAGGSAPTYTPIANFNGSVTLTMNTNDGGNTGSGGALVDTDTRTITVTSVNDAPQGANKTVTINEDTPYTVTAADFGFTDPGDSPANNFTQVTVNAPNTGTLTLNGVAITSATSVTIAQINAGNLVYTPTANGNGTGLGAFTFQVKDDGGTANGGVDTDPTPNTISFNVTAVNDAPVGVNDTVTTNEDTAATGNVLTNDTDIDGPTLTVTQFVVGGTTFTAGQTATLAGVGTLRINTDGGYTFTPAANYNGAVPVATYTVSDGALTSTATLGVTITAVNDAPQGTDKTVTINEDAPYTVTAADFGFTDPSDSPANSFTQVTVNAPTSGTLTLNGVAVTSATSVTIAQINAGNLIYTPTANGNGTGLGAFTFQVKDDGGTANGGVDTDPTPNTVSFNVTAVNDAPVGVNDTVTTNEDTAATGNVLTNDADVDSPTLTVTQFVVGGTTYSAGQTAGLAGVGTLQVNADGSYTFTPAANFNGSVPVATYTVSDGALTSTATLSVTITPVNDAPTAVNDTTTTLEDTSATGNVLTNDSDVDGNTTLTVTQFVVGGTTYTAGQTASLTGVGTLQVNTDGSYTFNPAANYNGAVPVATYTVTDGALTSAATLSVSITPVNDAPTAVNDTATTLEDTSATGNVLTNDSDVDGNTTLTVTQFVVGGTTYTAGQTASLAGVGTLQVNADGGYTFTPATNYNGAVPVATYTVTDGALTSAATLSVSITPVNDAPTAVNDAATTLEDTSATGNVLTNDSDVDGNTTLTVTQFVVGGTTYTAGQTASLAGVGTLQVNADGGYTFTPATNYNGAVPVATYTVTDGALTSTATLSVTITPVNDAPTAVDDISTTLQNTPATGNVLTNDSDVDGNTTLTVTQFVVGGTTYTAGQTATLPSGTLLINTDGNYTFTPVANYNGTVPVATYTVTDGALTSTATLSVTVTPVNRPPVGVNDTVTTNEDTAAAGNVLTNDTDPDSPTLTVTQFVVGGTTYTAGQTATLAGVGTLQVNADGSYAFNPTANYNGAVPVATYTVSDGALTSTATLSVTITPVNDAPTAVDNISTTLQNTPATGNVLTNDSDVDGNTTLTVTQFVVGGTTYTAGQTATLASGTLLINTDGSYTFTPATNYNGAVPAATYTVSDGAATSTATLSVAVTPVNDAPTAANDAVTTLEDTPATGNVLANDSDVDGNTALTVTQFVVGGTTYTAGQTASLAGVGTLQVNADGSYTFNPTANYNGAVPVASYTVSDGALTSTATLSVTITPVNDAPSAVNDTATTPEDTPATGNVLANDSDVDGNTTLTVTQFVVGGATYTAGQTATLPSGTLLINTDGTYTFTPAANYNGAVPVATYTVSDGALTSTATLSVTITPVNDAPTAVNDTATTLEDTPATGNVLANDSDVDGSTTLTVTQFVIGGTTYTAGQTATLPSGTLLINTDGSYTFTPAADYNGAVPVATYTVSDGALTSTATLSVGITPVNDAPTAVNDTATTLEDTPATGNVLANDSDVDGNTTLTVTQFVVGGTTYTAGQTATLPSGTLQINTDGSYTFTPAADYNGAVPVATYTVTDGALTSSATLSVSVTPVADAPTAVNDTATTLEDTPTTGNVLTNDSDVDGNTTLTVTQFVVGGTTYTAGQTASLAGVGTLQVNTDGSYTFNPAANYNGAVPVATYTVSDGALTSTATLTIAITPVNDAPTAVNDSVTALQNAPVSGSVLTNDSDVDGNTTLTVTQFVVSGTTYTAGQTATLAGVGTLQVNTDGSYTFTPATNYTGAVPVATYTVSDGALTSTATLSVSITAVNDVPVAVNDTATTLEDTPATGNVLANDSDAVGNPLAVTQFVVDGTTYTAGQTATLASGTLLINADGSYTFTPAANYNGPVPAATYTTTDGLATATATLTVSITPANDAPTAVNDTVTTLEDTPATGNVLANDSDVDGNTTLTVTQFVVGGTTYTAGQAATLAGVGTLQVNTDGSYTFNPAANYNGAVPVATYTVSDGAATSTATLSVAITPVNDAPTAVNDTVTTPEDTPVSGNVFANDSFVEGRVPSVTQFVINGTTYTAGTTATLPSGTLVISTDGSYTFNPAANYNGPVPVATYTVTDGAASSTATLSVSITPVNDAPTAVNDAATTPEDTPATGNVLANDSDVDGNTTLTVTQFVVGGTTYTAGQTASLAGVGTLQVNADGSYAFNPAANYNGAVPVATYTVTDGALTSTATLSVTITPVNDAPTAVNDTATTPEDTPATGNVLANDSDVDGNTALTVTQFVVSGTTYSAGQTATLAGVGTLQVNADGSYTFNPAANYNGAVPAATYTVSDGAAISTATLSIAITPVNDAPTAVNDTATALEDTPVTGNVLANDSDVEGSPLGVTGFAVNGTTYAAGQVANLAGVGTLLINTDGTYTFAPAANYNGPVPVATYTVSDGVLTSTATLSVAITPVNDAPNAVNDTATTLEDTPVNGNVLANDNDVDGNALGVTQFVVNGTTYTAGQTATLAGVGTLQINADGSYAFTPAANYNGTVPVATYTVSDGTATSTATLGLTVTPINDAPTAVNDSVTALQNTPVSGNVLANDSDVDGNALGVTQFVVGGTTYTAGQTASLAGIGTLQVNADGGYTFTPATNYTGAVPVTTYTVSDGSLTSTATLSVAISPVNDLPVARDDTATTLEDTPVSGNVLANDSDSVGNPLAVTQFVVDGTTYAAGQTATLPAGTLVINADGSYSFTPTPNFNGAVPLVTTYTATDGLASSTATLSVSITPVNDAPTAVNDTVTTPEDTPASGNVLANDSDVDSPTLTVTGFVVGGSSYTAGQTATLAGVGTLQVNTDGSYTFNPAANYNGAVPVATYTVSDGALASTATLTIGITPVNDAPTAVNDSVTALQNTPVSGSVLANDSDVDGNTTLTVTQFVVDGSTYTAGQTASLAGVGTLQVNADGRYTFAPATNYTGAVPVTTYTVSDGALTGTATLSVAISPVNDVPVVRDDTANTLEDTPVSGNVLANDSDAVGNPLAVTQFVVDGTTYVAGTTATLPAGTLVINADGRYTFTPAPNYNGAVPLVTTYTASDGIASASGTLSLNITPVNDAPTAVNDTVTTPEDTPVTGNVLANDSDVDSPTLTVTQFTVGGNSYTAGATAILGGVGTLRINADGGYTFNPAADYNGPVPVATYTVSDGALTSTATLTVTITPVNDAPRAVDDAATTLEDTPATGNVLRNDSDVDGNTPLTVTQFVVGGSTYTSGQTATLASGTLRINADGSYLFTPAANYNGPVPAATYTVSDGALTSTATLSLTVTAVNDPPVARPDTGLSDGSTPTVLNVLGNDSDPEGGPLVVSAINGTPIAVGGSVAVQGGRVGLNADGTLTFTPDPAFTGTPQFSYTVADASGATASAGVTLTVGTLAGADVQQLLGDGPTAFNGGRDPGMIDTRRDTGRETMYVPPYIIGAVNGIRSLHGTNSVDALGPVRAAVDGIRSLGGVQPIDVDAPILDLVENLQQRFRVIDPTQALFERQGESELVEARNSGDVIVLSNGDGAGAERGDLSPPADGNRGALPPALPATPERPISALLFSDQLAFQAGQGMSETDLLFAALMAELEPSESTSSL